MTIFTLLIGIVVAAAVFAALLWSVYRAVVTKPPLQYNYVVLSASTLLIVAAITWNFFALMLVAGVTGTVTGAVAVLAERRWSKLLPVVQVVLALLAFFAAMDVVIQGTLSGVLSGASQNDL